MNGVRFLTVIDSEWWCERRGSSVNGGARGEGVQRWLFGDRSLLEHLHIQANVSLLSFCNILSTRLLFWRLWKQQLIILPQTYNPDLRWFVSFRLAPNLPRLVAWERRTTVANRQALGKYIYRYSNIVHMRFGL